MGFIVSAERVILSALAETMAPPPPPDITRWCEHNIEFDDRSPMPGPFDIKRFSFLREIHEVLSPEHPAREVTVRGSAQIAKTESIINPTVAAWHEFMPLNSLVVHPTTAAARDWIDQKWFPLRRRAPALRNLFGRGGADNSDAKFRQETIDRTGILKITSAGSPDDLAQTSHRLVVMDDLSKFEMHAKGDPEAMAESRASSFEDAKILRASTPLALPDCRITKAFRRSDQRFYHMPCPHCGNEAPFTWENFKARLDPENLAAAHFSCESCGSIILHSDKAGMIANGRWIAQNPRGDHPGFHLWRAYAPQRDWASIAYDYARVMGWTTLGAVETAKEADLSAKTDAKTEQTFWNDVLGLPYEMASGGLNWEWLRDRVEGQGDDKATDAEAPLPRGIVPACGVLLTAGVDCQDDRVEVHIVAFGRALRRWTVDYLVIPHRIEEEACWKALDALLNGTWRTQTGLRLPLDMLAIDSGNWDGAVFSWAKRHLVSRVVAVKGASSANGPAVRRMQFDKKKDREAKVRRGRGYMVNVSQMKADFYGWLGKTDPIERGFCAFAAQLGDEFYRMITAEVRVQKRARSGVVTSVWDLVEPGRRNEALDTMLYAEAAARLKGWATMTDEQWSVIEAQRGDAPPEPQGDLFDAAMPAVPVKAQPAPAPQKQETRPDAKGGWIKRKPGGWL